MFREMRRKKQKLTEKQCLDILRRAKTATLALSGDDGYPYSVPINFVYEDGKIYFHGAKAGHKVDALKTSDKVCFTVYGNERIDESESWAPYVQSVVVFGRCRLLEAGSESIDRLKEFAMKYYPSEQLVDENIAHAGRAVQMFEITIEHMSGKQVQEK